MWTKNDRNYFSYCLCWTVDRILQQNSIVVPENVQILKRNAAKDVWRPNFASAHQTYSGCIKESLFAAGNSKGEKSVKHYLAPTINKA